jgi:hypothetical protein
MDFVVKSLFRLLSDHIQVTTLRRMLSDHMQVTTLRRMLSDHIQVTTLRWMLSPYNRYDRLQKVRRYSAVALKAVQVRNHIRSAGSPATNCIESTLRVNCPILLTDLT